MIYELLSAVGGLGLLAQTVLGFAHGGGPGGHSGIHVHGHVHLHSHALENVRAHGHLHTAQSPASAKAHAPTQPTTGTKPSPLAPFFDLLSPLALFTICLGAGVTGLLLQMRWHQQILVAFVAAAGGIGLYSLVVRPLWGLIFHFVSKPAETLSAAVAQEAEADSRFDSNGKGIVRLNVDGQLVRILAQLESDDVAQGAMVSAGEKLVVTKIDPQKNTCRVTRL
jgi:hypothetical protein